MRPDFDELVGDVSDRDRDRLRRVHEMLVAAGPPPELPPELQRPGKPPTADIAFFPKRRHAAAAVLAAALAAAAFGGGYLLGHSGDGDGFAARQVVRMRATPGAPAGALASLRLGKRDSDGNWPMEVRISGLRQLPDAGYYNLYLTRRGKPTILCGSFDVVGDPSDTTTVRFTVPYRVGAGNKWVITEQPPGVHDPGRILLTT